MGTRHSAALAVAEYFCHLNLRGVSYVRSDDGGVHVCLAVIDDEAVPSINIENIFSDDINDRVYPLRPECFYLMDSTTGKLHLSQSSTGS